MAAYNFVTFRTAGGYGTDKEAFDALMQLTDVSLEVFFPAAQGKGPNNAYEIWTNVFNGNTPALGNIVRSNVTLYGGGFDSVIRQPNDGQVVFMVQPPNSNPGLVRSNIVIHDLLIDGCMGSESGAYSEHSHLIRIAGVNGFKIYRTLFINAMGDGLFIGGPVEAQAVDNANIAVENCVFESTNLLKRGRNAVTLTDAKKYVIQDCQFTNIGQSHPPFDPGPGAIDVEPTASGSVVFDGTINGCTFNNVNRSAIALYNGHNASCTKTKIANCTLNGSGFGFFDIENHDDVEITGNTAINMNSDPNQYMGRLINNARQIYILNNSFSDGTFILIGNAHNFSINDNIFTNCGKNGHGAIIIQVADAYNISVISNDLYNCAQQGGVGAIYYLREPNIKFQYANIVQNTVHNPNGIFQIGAVVAAGWSPPYPATPLYNYVDPTGNYPASIYQGNIIKKP